MNDPFPAFGASLTYIIKQVIQGQLGHLIESRAWANRAKFHWHICNIRMSITACRQTHQVFKITSFHKRSTKAKTRHPSLCTSSINGFIHFIISPKLFINNI